MLIALYLFIVKTAVPQIGAYVHTLTVPFLTIVITLAGIVMLFGAVGMRISQNLGSTVIGGIFNGVGYICRTIIHAIGWVITNFFRIIPRVYNGSNREFTRFGIGPLASNILSFVIVLLVIAIII